MRDQRDTGKTRIYISHHHSPYENDFTARLEADLSAARADVRTDDDSVTRDAFVQVMLESRTARQFFLVVITPDSVASPFVQREVSVALHERAAGRILSVIPIYLLPTPLDEIPDPWRQLLWIDASQGYESAHQEILAAIGLTGPALSDPMSVSDATRWRQSTPGASQADTPSQPVPIAGERDRRTTADPDTSPLPPLARADEPDTGPLPPLHPPPGAEPPPLEAHTTETDRVSGGVSEQAGDAPLGDLDGGAGSGEAPVGVAKSTEAAEDEGSVSVAGPPAAEATADQASSDGLYDGSLWDVRLIPAEEPAGHTDAPTEAMEQPAPEQERHEQHEQEPWSDAPAAQPAQPAPSDAETPDPIQSGDLAPAEASGETTPSPPDAPALVDEAPAQDPALPHPPPISEPAPWSAHPPAPYPAPAPAPDAPATREYPPAPPAPLPDEAAQAPAPFEQPAPWYSNTPSIPEEPPDPDLNSPYHSPLEAPPGAEQWPMDESTSSGADRAPGGTPASAPPPGRPRAREGEAARGGAPAAIALERVAFTAYHPKEVQRAKPAPLLVYLALDDAAALAQVAAQAAERLAGRLDQYRAGMADQRLALRRGAKLRIIPTIPGFHVNPQWMDVTWDEDAQQHEFSLRADRAAAGHAAEGAVRVYQGLTLRAEIPLSIYVSEGAGGKLTPDAFASAIARAYRRVFASYSHRDTPVVESCEAAAEAMGDRYLRDVMSLQSGQLWNSQLMKMIAEADVFQLFWSKNASRSGYVRQEWEYALTLQANRPGFIRPVYWTTAPFAIPPELNPLHFEPLELSALGWSPVRRFFYIIQS